MSVQKKVSVRIAQMDPFLKRRIEKLAETNGWSFEDMVVVLAKEAVESIPPAQLAASFGSSKKFCPAR
jgi:hypothetical protein